ncbi:uncharacterized protein [Hemitrygon akajei]|uniref:uncharacterized protein isoform X5 n=1 Tax=Hemitrygon akajei TaxID=2704970 RepID=UPI003BF96B3A
MSGRLSRRSCSNTLETMSLSINEKILRECHLLYMDSECGIVRIASQLDLGLLAPRKKIIVMLMGNHSAGKSSFINWYIEEHIQKTGVATETQGFTFITSGKKRESLTGKATLHLYPHFQKLEQIKGLEEYLSTEVSTSKQKKFNLVIFIDTPGLVDGDMTYEFDVDKALIQLGEQADLIFVFFDPMGQALCKRTLNVVEKLNENQGDKIKFYLSKADEAGPETDRQPSRCVNQIQEVCATIEKTINRTVQNTLDQLEKDCGLVIQAAQQQLKKNSEHKSKNRDVWIKRAFFSSLAFLVPLSLLTSFIISNISREFLVDFIGEEVAKSLLIWAWIVSTTWNWLTGGSYVLAVIVLIGFIIISMLLSKCYSSTKPTLSRKERNRLQANLDYVQSVIVEKKVQLQEMYLSQCVSEQDLS